MKNAIELAPNYWYSHETGMVMLDVNDAVGEVGPQSINGETLFPKQEYHCTLVSIRREQDAPHQEQEFVNDLASYLDLTGTPGEERYLCAKDEERTVVAPIQLVGAQALQGFIRGYFSHYAPFFHVTLLKNEATKYGIRISSEQDLADRCTIL
jgi:hypothetical protein